MAQGFDIKPDEVVAYHSGICYSRVKVTSREAAEKIAKGVAGRSVNGGWFHGMPLGGITPQQDGTFEVMV